MKREIKDHERENLTYTVVDNPTLLNRYDAEKLLKAVLDYLQLQVVQVYYPGHDCGDRMCRGDCGSWTDYEITSKPRGAKCIQEK